MMSVRDIDKGWNRAMQKLRQTHMLRIRVGVPRNSGIYPDGRPVWIVAAAHQAHTAWATISYDEHQAEILASLEELQAVALRGGDIVEQARKTGGVIKQAMEAEIAKQGLIDTGRLLEAVKVAVSYYATGR